SRGSASCSNARPQHVPVLLAPRPGSTASSGTSGSWLRSWSPCRREAGGALVTRLDSVHGCDSISADSGCWCVPADNRKGVGSDGAAALRGQGASRGSASCSNARPQHVPVLLAPRPGSTASSGASRSWLRSCALASRCAASVRGRQFRMEPGRRSIRRCQRFRPGIAAAGRRARPRPTIGPMSTPAPRTIPLQVLPDTAPAAPLEAGAKQLGGDKIGRSPVQFADAPVLRKPSWIRVRIPSGNAVANLKAKLRENRLVTVCEEARCPNIHECFGHGTPTFMILGEVCTRRCSFCDVAHGRPKPLDASEPVNLGNTVADMGLKYVVVTSVDRDDLRDG